MLNIFKNHFITPLGGLNNQNYLLNYYNNKYVLRIPNKNNREFSLENQILDIVNINFISPPIVYHNKFSGILLSRYISNSTITEYTPNDDLFMKEFTTTLKKFHSFEVNSFFNPIEDIKNNIQYLININYSFNIDIYKLLNKLNNIEFIVSKDVTLGLCHNDLNPSNVLYDNNKVYLIDFEFSSMGDIFFDLGMFAWLLNDQSKKNLLLNYFGTINKKLIDKLDNYIFIAKLWNAIWSINKSLTTSNINYDYELGANIILKDLMKSI